MLLNKLSQLHGNFVDQFLVKDNHHLHIGCPIVFARGTEHFEGIAPSFGDVVERQCWEWHSDKAWSDVRPRKALEYRKTVSCLGEISELWALKSVVLDIVKPTASSVNLFVIAVNLFLLGR